MIAAFIGFWAALNYEQMTSLFRVEQRSTAYVAATLCNVAFTIGATILLVVVVHKGPLGVLVGNFTGTLANGTTWVADVPANWNGTLLLYSHGFGPLTAADAPDPGTQAALLARGYALAGSSYDPNGSEWALDTAVSDQFGTLAIIAQRSLGHRAHQYLQQLGIGLHPSVHHVRAGGRTRHLQQCQ